MTSLIISDIDPGMLLKRICMLLKLIFFILLAGLLLIVVARLFTEAYARPRTFSIESAPAAPVAIVFGAGLQRDGTPTPVLRDRVRTAADLYFAGKVEKLLMSGDNRFIDYNEPGAMKAYAISLGVPEDDIVLDFAGRRTYDTCYRARAIFGVQHALLITQNYHLPRALTTCNFLGLSADGVSADRRTYSPGAYRFWQMRELAATIVALWEVWVTRPLPVLGNPEPIFPGGSSYTSPGQS